MMSPYFNEVLQTPILSGFSKEQIQHFLIQKQMFLKSYAKDTVIHFDGDGCDALEVVIKGKVIIDRIDTDGNLLTITEFSEGDIIGGNIMFSSNPVYLMTVTALEDAVLLIIPKKDLFNMLCNNKLFLKTYLEFVSDLMITLGDKLRTSVLLPLRQKIIQYLKQLYKEQNSTKLHLPTSKKMLAEKLGVQRTSLSRELQKMTNEGIIDLDRQIITLIDEKILE